MARQAVGLETPKCLIEFDSGEQQQLVASQPTEVTRSIDESGLDTDDLLGPPQLLDPRVDLLAVLVDVVAFRCGADDVQLIQRAEPCEKFSKGWDYTAVLRQKRQDVGVEGKPP